MTVAASVIVPAFNAEDHIAQAVRSVLAQSVADWELIIAADDGRDYLAVLAAQDVEDARLRCVATGGVGSGAANARNVALAAAHGRLIVSLDADDRLQPEALKTLLPLALQHGAVYSDIAFTDFATGRPLRNCNRPMPSGLLALEEVLTGNLHTFAGIAFDRQRLPDVQWPHWARRWEDMLFVAMCCDRLGRIYYIPQPLYEYRRREGSVCNRPETAREFREAAAEIGQRLEQDAGLLSHTPGSRGVMRRYLRRNEELEAMFEQAMRQGTCRDYQDFMAQHLERYYRL